MEISRPILINSGRHVANIGRKERMDIYSRGSAHVHRDASLERQLPASRERERDGVIRS